MVCVSASFACFSWPEVSSLVLFRVAIVELIFLEFSIEAKFLLTVLFSCMIDELYLLIELLTDCIWIFEVEFDVLSEVMEVESALIAVDNFEIVVAFFAALTLSSFR